MKYEVKFIINDKGFKKIIEADNEALAKQKLLASINIISCEYVKENNSKAMFDMPEGFDKIFGGFK